MRAYRVYAVMLRQAYETRRNLDRVTDMVFWPLIDVLTWGAFSFYLASAGHVSAARPLHLLAGIILWGGFRALQRDIAVGFLTDVWSRNIVGLFASPLGFGEYMAALIALDIIKLLISVALASILAWAISVPLLFTISSLVPALLLLTIFGASIGILVTGLVLRFTSRVQSLAYGIAGVLMPLSCVFYPLSALPAPLRHIAWVLPSTQAFEDMRSVLDGHDHSAGTLAWSFCLAGIALAASWLFFVWIVGGARQRGHLVRLD